MTPRANHRRNQVKENKQAKNDLAIFSGEGTIKHIMRVTGRLDVKRVELEDQWDDNVKQGHHLINSLRDHFTFWDDYEQAWDDYGQLVE